MASASDRIELDELKSRVDLVELFRHHGLEAKKVGKNYFCRCPFHEDAEASLSINPKDRLLQCFGCKQGGDCSSGL